MRDLLGDGRAGTGHPDGGPEPDTYRNAIYTAAKLEQLGLHKILLVTSAFHMRRSEALFAARGLEVIPAPPTTSA